MGITFLALSRNIVIYLRLVGCGDDYGWVAYTLYNCREANPLKFFLKDSNRYYLMMDKSLIYLPLASYITQSLKYPNLIHALPSKFKPKSYPNLRPAFPWKSPFLFDNVFYQNVGTQEHIAINFDRPHSKWNPLWIKSRLTSLKSGRIKQHLKKMCVNRQDLLSDT